MSKIYKEIIKGIINQKLRTQEQVLKLTRELAREHRPKTFPSLIQILAHANNTEFQKLKHIITKPTRTISGVTPIAIMTSPEECPHGKCITCPGGPKSHFGDIPQSYTGHEPATMRGIRNNFDSYLQVFNRLEQYILLNQSIEKVELIIMGGTFPARKKAYQNEFIMYAFKAMNDFSNLFFTDNKLDFKKFKTFFELPAQELTKERTKNIQNKILKLKSNSTLKKEQKINETTKVRCVALCIETRPDYAQLEHANLMLEQGCTRVELGIQSTQEKVLKAMNRGHATEQTIQAIRILKDLGFKVAAHFMLGLPKQSDRDIYKLFTKQEYRPDMLKIYPCMVLKGTKLYELWKGGKFKPLTAEKAASIIVKFKKIVPQYCRIQRIQRDISSKLTEVGVNKTNLRQYIHKKYKIKCNCIRCREVGQNRNKKLNIEKSKILIRKYKASKGKEFFISIEDTKNNVLFGFCRLRFPSQELKKEITKNSAIIRELHVYSKALALGKHSKESYQHRGLGKKLVKKAEEIALENNKNKMIIISGIGVKEYYIKKLEYKKDGPYVSKLL